MKDPLKPRDKITQHMTRDGLVRENQTTGEVQSVSGRDAEQNFSLRRRRIFRFLRAAPRKRH